MYEESERCKHVHNTYIAIFLLKCQDSETSSDVEPQVDSEDEKSVDIVFCEVLFQLILQFVLHIC